MAGMNRWGRAFCGFCVFFGAGAGVVPGAPPENKKIVEAREKMVQEEIIGAGIKDKRVIDSLRHTQRHEFVPTPQRASAYYDMALPIGESQTISPPFVVAYMTEQLEPQPDDKVLEIGTGSGYQAAVLSPLVKEVYSIEIKKPLGERAAATLKRLQYKNVFTKVGDGYKGWEEHAPFDKIIVTCSPENVPKPLVEQLKEGGRMIIPLGERYQQSLYLLKKEKGELVREALLPTMFVPMTGAAEAQREVLPDAANPKIVNGSFEDTDASGENANNWYYQRQLKLEKKADAPEGKNYLTFTNKEPGRGSHALQAFGVDGRTVKQLQFSITCKGSDIRQGVLDTDLPGLSVLFYDQGRKQVGFSKVFGGWKGAWDWRRETRNVKVPPDTREVIIRIGLHGAIGEFSLDEVAVEGLK